PRGAARPLQTGGWPPPRGGARRWRRGGGNRRRPARRSAPVCVPRGRPSLGERPRRADGGRRVRPPQQRRGGHRRGRGSARAVRLLAALGVTVLGVAAVAAQQPLAARLAGRVSAGLQDANVQEVARACGPQCSAAEALRVAGTLTALGVPPAEAVELVRQTLRSGGKERDVLALPGRVEAEVAGGATPAQAAAGL